MATTIQCRFIDTRPAHDTEQLLYAVISLACKDFGKAGMALADSQRLDPVPVSVNVAQGQGGALLPAEVILGEGALAMLG